MFFSLSSPYIIGALLIPACSYLVLHRYGRGKIYYALLFFLLIACIVISFRTGIIMIVLPEIFRKSRRRIALTFFITLLFLGCMFMIKSRSTEGRFFILRNTANIIRENSLGIGSGNFCQAYMHAQAKYFQINGTDNRFAFLASDVQYALNEYLQFSIEYGVLPVVGFCIMIFFLLRHAEKQKKSISPIIALSQLLLSGALYFSFHNWYVLILFSGLIVQLITLRTKKLYLIWGICYAIAVLNHVKEFADNKKISEARSVSTQGYFTLADSLLQRVNNKKSDTYLFVLAEHQMRKQQFRAAKETLLKTHIINSSEQMLLADCDMQLNQYREAEINLLNAIFMVPSRLRTKFALSILYNRMGDLQKEKLWLLITIISPEKIPSFEGKTIKLNAFKRLMQID